MTSGVSHHLWLSGIAIRSIVDSTWIEYPQALSVWFKTRCVRLGIGSGASTLQGTRCFGGAPGILISEWSRAVVS